MHGLLYSNGPILGECGDLKGIVLEYYNATRVHPNSEIIWFTLITK